MEAKTDYVVRLAVAADRSVICDHRRRMFEEIGHITIVADFGGHVSNDQTITRSAEAISIAAAVRAGEEAAFNTLEQRHRRELLIHCYRMLGSLDDAEDVVQDALLRGWKYRASLKEGAPVRPWLSRVATNACLDAIGHDAPARSVGRRGPNR
jgi:Sigma-70 region 2